MGFEDVEAAAKVAVAYADSHARLFGAVFVQSDSTHQSLFAESAVAIVDEQQAGGRVASHIDVRPAILVEVGRGHGQSVTVDGLLDSGCFADFFELTLAVVAEKRTRAGRQ